VTETELERIREAYEERDAAGASQYRWDNPGYVAYMQAVERALLGTFADADVRIEGARVLDVGCGSGYFLHRLREYGAGECHGIDLMESRIAEGRKRYPTLELQVGSATQLPFADRRFDLVTQFTCLSSIVDDDVRAVAAREIRRVSGGWILSFDMRGLRLPGRRKTAPATPTVGLDSEELGHLFGPPTLLRSVMPPFELTQLAGRHDLLARAAGTLPPLRSHYLGLWSCTPGVGTQ
jgi:SAM-dependent methyltransferase